MTLRCLIIDDEPLAHEVLLKYAKDLPFLNIVGQCYMATDALQFLNTNEVDLLFLDIKMPKLRGLDFLRTLRIKPLVIITSAYEEYALESYELDVIDYLHKPFGFDRFLKAVSKAQEIHQLKNKTSSEPQSIVEKEKSILIKVDKKHIQVDVSDIYYLESYGNYVKVWLEDSFHLTPKTLSSFEQQLQANGFIRIHKQQVINAKKIDYFEGNMVKLLNGTELQVGKNNRILVKQWITDNLK